jgi:hypothetical protein
LSPCSTCPVARQFRPNGKRSRSKGSHKAVLADWVENGKAPGTLTVLEQTVEEQPKTVRALPLCHWPMWPKYRTGDPTQASSLECAN